MDIGRVDVAVVGGSFAGLAAAMQLGRARRRTLVVDAGRPRNRFAPASHGFLGQDGRAPADILAAFRSEIAAYPAVSLMRGEVVRASSAGPGIFALALADGGAVEARRVILATGVSDELPEVPGLAERWGVSVLHCPYCHGYEAADGRLGMLAESEAALHKALLLPDWSRDVVLFTNGSFEPAGEQRDLLAARGVRIESSPVVTLLGDAPALSGVRLADGRSVALDALFTSPATRLTSPLAEQLGCAIDDGPFGPMVRTDARKATTVEGVYCAGDAARAPHNATWAAADGATAGVSAHQSLVFEPMPR